MGTVIEKLRESAVYFGNKFVILSPSSSALRNNTMSPTDPSTSTFNNGSILAIESDLETIKEKELETFYPQTTSPNINDSLVVSSLSTASFHTNSIASSPSLNSFVQHLTFHLWLMLPILLLFIPSESKWMDRVLRNLLRKSNHALI